MIAQTFCGLLRKAELYYGIKNYHIKAMENFTSLYPVKVFGQGFDFFIYLAMYLGKWIQYTT